MTVDDPQTYAILGAGLTVHRVMGGGLVERPYILALAIELRERCVPFELEPAIDLHYRGHPVGRYRPDFICFADIVVEVKVLSSLQRGHYAQAMHYLMASGATRALLLNFGPERFEWRRFSRGPNKEKSENQ